MSCRKPLNRRLIIVEGVYANYGDMAPLDKLYQLKEKYKYVGWADMQTMQLMMEIVQ
jgi:7-keto-8-aminopelargonate synthetase-like enzyme